MVVKAARKKDLTEQAEPTQLELVKLPKHQIQQQISNEIAEIVILKARRQKALGNAKSILNEIKEKIERAEKLSAQVCSPKIKVDLEEVLASLAEDGDDEGEEPSDFEQGLQDSLDEAAAKNESEEDE